MGRGKYEVILKVYALKPSAFACVKLTSKEWLSNVCFLNQNYCFKTLGIKSLHE